jgi:hypothetical protein
MLSSCGGAFLGNEAQENVFEIAVAMPALDAQFIERAFRR